MEDFAVTQTKHSIRRVALACIQCRARKVRCDATQPACNRCRMDEKQCEYQKSRRGGRPRRPIATSIQSLPETHPSGEPTPWIDVAGTTVNSSSSQSTGAGSTQSLCESLETQTQSEMQLPNGTHLMKSQVDQLLTQYYTYFHVSHPCVLPRWTLQSRMGAEPAIAEFLLPVLLYIGSVFTHTVESAPLHAAASLAMQSGQCHSGLPNPYYVQALMLYSIAVYWCNEPERGRKLLDEAINAAFVLGMQRREFASQYGLGDPVLEESWRRTWWQLHVTDVHISGSSHTYKGLSTKFPITTELPCEELLYEQGEIPTPTTLKQYNIREFSNIDFSSFAHLIGFTQGISRILATRRIEDLENTKDICANADTMMTAWCALLPVSKKRILRDDGSVDELVFKAMILMHTYVVDLHRQLSSLLYSAVESVSPCAPPPPPEANKTIKDEAHIHTAKVLFAVDKLNNLLTLPTRFTTHTPFIICMIANMTIAHLSACRYVFQEPRLSLERDKIRLNMGVLKMLGEFWPAGLHEYESMGVIAKEILSLEEEEIRIPGEAPVLPLDALDFNFDFDVNWACDMAVNVNGPFLNGAMTF
ncbi:hypothetical protein CC80DRAFT_423925 [Byssothecium circinans]|uniref:Zn(2)-C6 fungal-type domain-containing protein n=1 Tax=Byssothecium circinans TaxID=147558 RepID=A0A6A5THV6_9PLEO|nr:hypothetical protein CC80DRAFT_423925 [Byssothecium circinans]